MSLLLPVSICKHAFLLRFLSQIHKNRKIFLRSFICTLYFFIFLIISLIVGSPPPPLPLSAQAWFKVFLRSVHLSDKQTLVLKQ